MKDGAEIEAKYRLRPGQRADLGRRLGPPDRILVQRDVYFDVPGRVLRIRQENDHTLLTRKDAAQVSADGIKSRHEVEVPIPALVAPVLEEVFVWLGHRRLIEVNKERHEFDVEGFTICLDTVAGLDPPDFVELEACGGDLESLRSLRDHLGLAPDQTETRSYARMVAESTGT